MLGAVNMIKDGISNKSKYAFISRKIISSMEGRNSCIAHTCPSCTKVSHSLINFDRLQR